MRRALSGRAASASTAARASRTRRRPRPRTMPGPRTAARAGRRPPARAAVRRSRTVIGHAGSAASARPIVQRLLGGAAAGELEALGGGEVAVRLAVEVDADAAVDVDGGVREPVAGVGRPELRDGHLDRRPAAPRRAASRLPQGEALAEHVDVAVGQPLRDRLEGADRAAELLARLRVRRGQPQRALGDAELLGRSARPSAARRAVGRRAVGVARRASAGSAVEVEPGRDVAVAGVLGLTVDAGVVGLHQEDADAGRRSRRHQEQRRRAVPARTSVLTPVSRQPSPSAVAVGRLLGSAARSSATAAVSSARRRGTGQPLLALSSVPSSATQTAAARARPAARAPPCGRPPPAPGTARSGRGRRRRAPRGAPAEQPGLAELAPEVTVEPVAGRLDLLQPLGGGAVARGSWPPARRPRPGSGVNVKSMSVVQSSNASRPGGRGRRSR